MNAAAFIPQRRTLALVAWVLLLGFFFANVEIQIEGSAGWAANLPTWRIEKHWLLDLFWGGRAMTGYHAWVFPFVALFFHLPVDGAGRIWLPTFAAVLALFSAVQIPASRRVRTNERERAQKARDEAAATRERQRTETERNEPAYMPPPGYGPGTEVDTIADSIPPQHARQSPHP